MILETAPSRPPNKVDALVGAIARPICRGAIAPGEKLPGLRELAEQFEMTVPTAQRAVARLEELGLIAIRHGSGIRALDPRRHANFGAYPYWVEALRAEPEAAGRLLADFLELRTSMALDLLRKARPLLDDVRGQRVFLAVDELEALATRNASSSEIIEADLAIARVLLELAPQAAFSVILNSFEQLLHEIPEIGRAMYRTPVENVAGWRMLFELVRTQDDFRSLVLPLIHQVDEATCRRFVEELST